MKNLVESLFDKDLISKDITFGDLFELDREASDKSLSSPISQEFSVQRLKRLVKVKGEDNDEIIYNGIVKLIQDLEIKGNPEDIDKEWLKKNVGIIVNDLFRKQSYESFYIGFYNYGRLILGQSGLSLFDHCFNMIVIRIGSTIDLLFRRK